jgi:Domain of Unknown Function (DUF928)
MKAPKLLTTLTATLLSITLVTTTFPTRPVSAEPLPTLPIEFNPDILENPGRPGGRRRGGGSRGGCAAEPPLTAITYARTVSELGIEIAEETVGTLTTQAQPTLWFYLPTALSDDIATAFAIKNSDNELLYAGQLSGTTESNGIVGVTVPINFEVGQTYHWFFAIACGEVDSAEGEEFVVDGWIERQTIDPQLERRIERATNRNQAALYADAGFLQDAISGVATLRLNNPDDEALAQTWADFLVALDLSDLTTVPLLDCCSVVERDDSSDL